MDKYDVLQNLKTYGGIYAYMYGSPYLNFGDHKEVDKIVFLDKDELRIGDNSFTYIWGWPGPDYNVYEFADYEKTWAFREYDIVTPTPPDGMCPCEECIYQPMRWGKNTVSLPKQCPLSEAIIGGYSKMPDQAKGYCGRGVRSTSHAISPKYTPTADDLYTVVYRKQAPSA